MFEISTSTDNNEAEGDESTLKKVPSGKAEILRKGSGSMTVYSSTAGNGHNNSGDIT